MRRLIAIAREPIVLEAEFGHLNGAAALFARVLPLFSCAPARMREVKQKCAIAAHDDIRVTAFHFVVRAVARLLEQIAARLTRPIERIVGAIHRQSAPDIRDHPVRSLPAEHLGSFARLIVHGLAFVFPGHEIGRVGIVNGFAIAFVVVPKPPHAIRQSQHAGIDDPIRCQLERLRMIPLPEVGAGEMNDRARMVPVREIPGTTERNI